MNVTLPDNKLYKKYKIMYATIIGICIISLILVIYSQFFEGKTVTTVGSLKGKSEEGYEILKSEFDKLFTNTLQNYDDKYRNKKEKLNQDLVYTSYTKEENQSNNYDLSIRIPYINIKGDTASNYNEEIQNTFKQKADDIMKTTNKNSIYTVEYGAYIQDGVLSVIIRANLKEGSNAQRVIIKTYNYNLEEDKEITLQELINMKSVDKSYVQNKIDEEIKSEQKKAEDLKALGYSIFERNANSEMYKLENVSEFYFHDGSIYIIFAYGNDKRTSEVDIAII